MAKIKNPFVKMYARQGLLMVLLAALLLEVTSLIQYFYAKKGLRKEADSRAQSEMTATRLRIENYTLSVENDARLLSWAMSDFLDNPDELPALITKMMDNNPVIANGFVAFKDNYYPQYGRWYEPVVTRLPEGLVLHQVGSQEHDYFSADWYIKPMQTGDGYWSEPYFDKDGVKKLVVTYSVPVNDDSGARVGILGVDVELDWLNVLVSMVKPYKNAFSTLTSRKGQLIAAPPETLSFEKSLRYESDIYRTGWKMSVTIPEDELYGHIKKISTLVLFLQILGLMLLILIIQWTAREQIKLENISASREKIEEELKIAREIQMAMIPKVFPPYPERKDIDIYASILPAKEVGGDLYDFYIRDEKLYFCIGDVSGKGVPASLVMAVTRSLFRTVSAHENSPGHIITSLNESMSEMNENNMFVTFFCGVLDLRNGNLRYCNAGHNAPVILNTDKSILPVEPNVPLGIVPGMKFQEQEIELRYDDAIFLYTDGLTEAENMNHDFFGEQRMLDALSGLKGSRSHLEEMQKAVESYVGHAPQSDDLTMLFIHYLNDDSSSESEKHLLIHNDIQQIPQLAAFVEAIAEKKQLDHSLSLNLNLALEEAVTNVIMYAYPKGTDGLVDIEAIIREHSLTFIVSDSGQPFDPTSQPQADISLGVDDRPIGGLGIYMVRNIMDSVSYRRSDGKNILTMIKNI